MLVLKVPSASLQTHNLLIMSSQSRLPIIRETFVLLTCSLQLCHSQLDYQ